MFTLKKHTETEIKTALDSCVASCPENSRVFEITPAIAAAVLDPKESYHSENRGLKYKKLNDFVAAMKAGAWGLTGDTLKFSKGGFALDGQHRYRACVKSGKSFITHVVFGIEDALFSKLDQGSKRTSSDIFQGAGITNSKIVAGACNWISIMTGPDPKGDRVSRLPEDMLALYMKPGVGDHLQVGLPLARAVNKKYGHPTAPILGLWWMMDRVNPVKARAFMIGWEGLDKAHAAAVVFMHGEILSRKARNSNRIHDRLRAALIILAWNEFSAGRKGNGKLFSTFDLYTDTFPSFSGYKY